MQPQPPGLAPPTPPTAHPRLRHQRPGAVGGAALRRRLLPPVPVGGGDVLDGALPAERQGLLV